MAKKTLVKESPLPVRPPKLTREEGAALSEEMLSQLRQVIYPLADKAFKKAFSAAKLADRLDAIEAQTEAYIESEILSSKLFNLRSLRGKYLDDLRQRNPEYQAALYRIQAVRRWIENGAWKDGVRIRAVPETHPLRTELTALVAIVENAEHRALEVIDLECDKVIAEIKSAGLDIVIDGANALRTRRNVSGSTGVQEQNSTTSANAEKGK